MAHSNKNSEPTRESTPWPKRKPVPSLSLTPAPYFTFLAGTTYRHTGVFPRILLQELAWPGYGCSASGGKALPWWEVMWISLPGACSKSSSSSQPSHDQVQLCIYPLYSNSDSHFLPTLHPTKSLCTGDRCLGSQVGALPLLLLPFLLIQGATVCKPPASWPSPLCKVKCSCQPAFITRPCLSLAYQPDAAPTPLLFEAK